jgi:hypothetical protein
LEAKVKTTNVTAIAGDPASGAGVRLSGVKRTNQAVGSVEQVVAHEFEVLEELKDTELVLELRSTSGNALFDPSTIRVVRVK